MPDYYDIQMCSKKFDELLGVFHAFRERLRCEAYSEGEKPWFVLTDGEKPWLFDVDWLGVTYRLTFSASVDRSSGGMTLVDPKIAAAVMETAGIDLVLKELMSGRVFSYGVKMADGNTINFSTCATRLFFELIGQSLSE